MLDSAIFFFFGRGLQNIVDNYFETIMQFGNGMVDYQAHHICLALRHGSATAKGPEEQYWYMIHLFK